MAVLIFLSFISLFLHQCCTSNDAVCSGVSLLGGVCGIQSSLPRQLLNYWWIWGESVSLAQFLFDIWRVLCHNFFAFFHLFPQAQPFWYRCVYILIWGKISLYKYVSCWVIAVSFPFLSAKVGLEVKLFWPLSEKGNNVCLRWLTTLSRVSELKTKSIIYILWIYIASIHLLHCVVSWTVTSTGHCIVIQVLGGCMNPALGLFFLSTTPSADDNVYLLSDRKVCASWLDWVITARWMANLSGTPAPTWRFGFSRRRRSFQERSSPSTSTPILGLPGEQETPNLRPCLALTPGLRC